MPGQQVLQDGNDDRAHKHNKRVDHGPEEGRARASSHAERDQGDQGGEEERGALEFRRVGQEEHTNGGHHRDGGRAEQLGTNQFDIGRADRASPHHPCRDAEGEPVREREAERDPQISPITKVSAPALSGITIKEAIRQIATYRAMVKASLRSSISCSPRPTTGRQVPLPWRHPSTQVWRRPRTSPRRDCWFRLTPLICGAEGAPLGGCRHARAPSGVP